MCASWRVASKRNCIGTSNAKNRDLYYVFWQWKWMSVVITLKVPTEMHYTVIPMGTSKVNSSQHFKGTALWNCHTYYRKQPTEQPAKPPSIAFQMFVNNDLLDHIWHNLLFPSGCTNIQMSFGNSEKNFSTLTRRRRSVFWAWEFPAHVRGISLSRPIQGNPKSAADFLLWQKVFLWGMILTQRNLN